MKQRFILFPEPKEEPQVTTAPPPDGGAAVVPEEQKKNPFVNEQPKRRKKVIDEKNTEKSADAMYEAFKGMVKGMMTALEPKNVIAELEKQCTDWFKKEYGAIPMLVQPVDEKGQPTEPPSHAVLPSCTVDVMRFIEHDIPVFLVGPAGCGKNEMVKKIAEFTKQDYYYSNCVTMEHKITGWTNASGTYMETPFYKAWTKGGIFLLDEMDASTPEVIDVMNMAIANRECDFPAPIGNVKANPKFRLIAAGNTFGEGANSQYCSRNKLDAATLDRFACIEMGYEKKIEDFICPDEALADFLREMRKAITESGIEANITYRCFNRSFKMKPVMPMEKIIRTCITKHMRKPDVQTVSSKMKTKGEWVEALNKVIREWE